MIIINIIVLCAMNDWVGVRVCLCVFLYVSVKSIVSTCWITSSYVRVRVRARAHPLAHSHSVVQQHSERMHAHSPARSLAMMTKKNKSNDMLN